MPYAPKADHRDNTQAKSQWTISPAEEVACFNRTIEKEWVGPPHVAWGLHFNAAGIAQYLGTSALTHGEAYELFLAKFIDGNQNDTWHGYPADPSRHQQDIPPTSIRKAWMGTHLRAALVRKIGKGQQCSL